MSPGITFKRRPMIAGVMLLIIVGGLSFMSVGKGTPADKESIDIMGS